MCARLGVQVKVWSPYPNPLLSRLHSHSVRCSDKLLEMCAISVWGETMSLLDGTFSFSYHEIPGGKYSHGGCVE